MCCIIATLFNISKENITLLASIPPASLIIIQVLSSRSFCDWQQAVWALPLEAGGGYTLTAAVLAAFAFVSHLQLVER